MVSTAAALFLALILAGLYIFVKYLVVRAQCKRVSMMIFYLLAITGLSTRMAIMISLNYRAFFATENLVLSVISLMFALMVGT